MTKALPYTRAGLKRAILAAREAGLYVIGMRPDGTLIFSESPTPVEPTRATEHTRPWDDIRA